LYYTYIKFFPFEDFFEKDIVNSKRLNPLSLNFAILQIDGLKVYAIFRIFKKIAFLINLALDVAGFNGADRGRKHKQELIVKWVEESTFMFIL
jgi:hypothetical protein